MYIDFWSKNSAAVIHANQDSDIKVIVVRGEGKFFCSGYDLKEYAQSERGHPCSQKLPWDPHLDYIYMGNNNYPSGCTACYMSLFHSKKPTIAVVHGGAIAGGSDIALCCDLLLMTKDAKIGYPPTRVWGVPTTAFWALRVGIQQAKRLLFTGDLIDGKEAVNIGLAMKCYDNKDLLYKQANKLALRISGVPSNQLWFNKLVINSFAESTSGSINNLQALASLLDGASRHTPEGIAFQKYAQEHGFKEAIKMRDYGMTNKGNNFNNATKSKL